MHTSTNLSTSRKPAIIGYECSVLFCVQYSGSWYPLTMMNVPSKLFCLSFTAKSLLIINRSVMKKISLSGTQISPHVIWSPKSTRDWLLLALFVIGGVGCPISNWPWSVKALILRMLWKLGPSCSECLVSLTMAVSKTIFRMGSNTEPILSATRRCHSRGGI